MSFSIGKGDERRTLFHDVNLEIRGGDKLGILGASGSGKSMMTACATHSVPRYVAHDVGGSLQIANGTDLTSFDQLKVKELRSLIGRQIGMVFQEPGSTLNPVMRCGAHLVENIQRHLQLELKDAGIRAFELLERTGIEDPDRIFDSYPHQISGGQQQRVVLALAVSHNPKLLIADEATTSLDSVTQRKVLDFMLELNQKQGTALWVISHDVKVLHHLGCHTLELTNGTLREAKTQATPSESSTPIVIGTESVLSAQDYSYYYPKSSEGFRDVNFDLKRGEILGVVGSSGSGKSTLAKALVKLLEAKGELTPDYPVGPVQLIFQSPDAALDPLQKVGNGLMEVIKIHHSLKRAQRKQKALDLMEAVGLEADLFERKPVQLSGGQKQRICIAKALACKPKILICDECVSSLDADVKFEIIQLLKELVEREGLSVLFITHDMGLLESFAHRILVMSKGQIVETGTAEQITRRPASTEARFLVSACL